MTRPDLTRPDLDGPSDLSDPTAEAWNTDRSRIVAGQQCPRLRYLEFHSGLTGYGIRRKARSLPMVTGIYLHKILAEVLVLALEQVDRPVIRSCIQRHVASYRKLAEEKGLSGLPEMPEERRELELYLRHIVDEQCALLEGFAWAYLRGPAQWILQNFEVVSVERELPFIANDPLDGSRVRVMIRPDLLLRRKTDRLLCYVDYKTLGGTSPSWTAQWEDSLQLMLTRHGIEHNMGEACPFAYILAVKKEARKEDKRSGREIQWSPLCYAYHRLADPPFLKEDWQTKWKWTDAEGKDHTLGPKYKREEVWLYPFDKPEDWTTMEWWVSCLPEEAIHDVFELLGPFEQQPYQLQSALRSLLEGEKRVREGLWAVYDAAIAPHIAGEPTDPWPEHHPSVVRALDTHFPQTWACWKYGRRYPCSMYDICKRQQLWEDPLGSGQYELRRPHHLQELQQMKARGIEPPAEQEGEEDE